MSRGLLKVLALCLAVVMLFAIAACGKQEVDTGKDTPAPPVDTAPAEEPPPAEEPTPEPEPEEVRDLGGRVIKVAAWWDMTPQGGSASGDRQVARRAEMEEKYNFKFEYVNVPWDQTVETYSSSVLGGVPFADIATLEDNWVIGLANSGFVTELEPLFDFSQEKWDQMTKSVSTVNGKVYGMATGKWWPRAMFFFNKKIFEREGLENPYDLMKNKQWTWAKMEELARKATKDTDNDSVIDQWGISGMDIDIAMVASNGAQLASIVDGKAKLNFREDPVVEAFNFYQKLCKDKIIYNKFDYGESPPWDIAKTMFQDGKIAMFWYQYWAIDGFRDNMADDYGIIMPPMGPSNKDGNYHCLITGHNFQNIPSSVKNVEDVAFIWNKWTEPYEEDLDNPDAWKDGHLDRMRDNESFDTLAYMYDNNCVMPAGIFSAVQDAVSAWWSGQDDLLKGEKTVAQIVDEKFDAIQAILDDFLTK